MENVQVQFLRALRAFLEKRTEALSFEEEEDWLRLHRLAAEQAVFPMIYEAVYPTASFQALPGPWKQQFKGEVRGTVIRQVMKTEAFLRLYRKILEEEKKVLVVKGAICRNIYPNPDARVSGDEDLYVEESAFRSVHDLFLKQGLQMQEGDDPEKSQVVTYFDVSSGLHIELHRQLFSEESAAYGRLNAAFEKVFAHAVQMEVQGVPLWTMSQTEHLLYLVFHGFKHFLHSGFGVRQVCDVVLFAKTYGAEVDWDWLMEQAKSFRADVFLMNLFEIGERYLGVSREEAHVPDRIVKEYREFLDCEALLDDLLAAGVFGDSSMDRKHSSLITLNAVTSDGRAGVGTYALRTLFPGVEDLKKRFTYLEKRPYLLPVAWIQRIWAYLRTQRPGDGDARESIEIGNQRVELLKKYRVIR